MSIESDIESYRDNGYTDSSLKKILKVSGYKDEEIEEAFKETSPAQTPKPTPKPPTDPYRAKARQFLFKFSIGLIILAGIVSLLAYHIIPIPQSIVSLENKYIPHGQTNPQNQPQTTTLSVPPGVKPGKCLILQEEYCIGKEFVFPKTGKKGVGFDLPSGTVIFAPVAGRLMYVPAMEADPPYPEVLLMLMTGGNIELANVKTTLAQATMVEAGQPIGEVASTTTIGGMSYDFSVFARPVSLADTLYSTFLKK